MSGHVQVHFWDGTEFDLTSYGHVSLQLSDGTYISWWPNNETKVLQTVQGKAVPNLGTDIGYEGGQGPRTHTLTDIDVASMQRWWRSFLATPGGAKWDATGNNCSTVAFHCLCEGNSFFQSYGRAVWTPSKLESVVKKYQEKYMKGSEVGPVKIIGI